VIATPAVVSYASQLSGQTVTVVCNRDQSFDAGELGYTLYENGVVYPTIYLPASTCNRLNNLTAANLRIVDKRKTRVVQSAAAAAAIDLPNGSAVDTLVHEATHILEQSTDEARVECDSYKNRAKALALFGLSSRQNAKVMRGIVATHENSDPSYLTIC
jgi:hypothetical protein